MKQKLFILLTAWAIYTPIFAQTPVPNGDFETWQAFTNYESPSPSTWWTSLNALSQFSASSVTVSKTTDAQNGTYAARLETKKIGTLLLSGLLVSGNFSLGTNTLKRGQPFTDKPTHLKGFYKYTPVNGDSCALAIELTKWKNNQHYLIADASLVTNVASTQYQAFDLQLNYYDLLETPDSITIVFSSSANGDSFQGQVGSTLFVDNISLDYTNTNIQNELNDSFSVVYPNPIKDELFIHLTENTPSATFYLYDINGKQLTKKFLANAQNRLDLAEYKAGFYFYILENEKGERVSGKLNIL